MKKKVISLMLIGAMVASMAACGSNGGDKGGTKDNDTSAAAESDGGASEGGDTLTVWTWDQNSTCQLSKKLEECTKRIWDILILNSK